MVEQLDTCAEAKERREPKAAPNAAKEETIVNGLFKITSERKEIFTTISGKAEGEQRVSGSARSFKTW